MKVVKWETNSRQNIYFKESMIKASGYTERLESQVVCVYPEIQYRVFLGFGGAITDAAVFSFGLLPPEKQEQFLSDCFSSSGLNYCFCRLPIGSSDFSLDSFSYAYQKDLSDFSIARDQNTVLLLAKKAKERNPNLHFLASPWSPPAFMKNSKILSMGGKLKDQFKQTYADYLSRYVLEYAKNGISIEYITIQNEPNAMQRWESCLYSPEEEADFAVNYLYPTFQKNHIATKILVWDHNKEKLYARAKQEMQFPGSLDAIAGFAFHWYTGDHFENIELTANAFPTKLLFHTEGCTGFSHFNPEEEIGNAQMYANDIIGDLNAGTNAYIDWNILLNHSGGPNHKNNYCNSPIMLNEDASDFIKNLTYTYIKHFSSIIQPNAKRIAFSKYHDKLKITSFQNPDGTVAIVMLNPENYRIDFHLCIGEHTFSDHLEPNSIVSYKIV